MAEKTKNKKKDHSFSLPVTTVVLSIGYIYVSTVFVFIDRWFGLSSSPGIMNAVFFTVVAVLRVFNYALAISMDPGPVPATYMPDVEDLDNVVHEIKRKERDLRYCQKCSHYKPPRAHHCRVCERCVLRMVLLIGSMTEDSVKDEEQNGGSFRITYIVSGLLVVPLCVALSVLLGWHIYLVLHNKTTIEYHEGVRALWIAEKSRNGYSHPYDLGAYENLTAALGPNILCWLWPTSGHIGSGLRFRTN